MGDRVFIRNPEVVVREVDDIVFLIHPDSESVFHLNVLGSALWRLLDQPTSLRQAVATIHRAFPKTPVERIEKEVSALMDDLVHKGLVKDR